LIVIFYSEENWRGQRAWDDCRRAMQAQGVKLDWGDYAPAPVPADENVFGVPEMQKWFVERTTTNVNLRPPTALSIKLSSYPWYGSKQTAPLVTDQLADALAGLRNQIISNRTARLVVAELKIELPGPSIRNDSNAAVLPWGEPQAKAEAGRLIKEALGPVVIDPVEFPFMVRQPEEIRPAQIVVQCQTKPTEHELAEFLPKPIATATYPDIGKLQVESVGKDSYKVTMLAPDTVAEYLKWSEELEPELALIRKALQRPYARMDGDYSDPIGMPVPNFLAIRLIWQRLAAMAQCHLAQGQPEEALHDLTLLNDLGRILEESRPMTLMSAMINAAVRALYAGTIDDGLRRHAWREPQLAALEKQLERIKLPAQAKQAFEMSRVSCFLLLQTVPPAQFFDVDYPNFPQTNVLTSLKAVVVRGIIPRKWTVPVLAKMMPRGWVGQNMVALAHRYADLLASLEPGGQTIFPDKVNAASQKDQDISADPSPYTFMASRTVPNFSKAVQRFAQNQEMVNQTLIVCALERYHLAHGEYPETLDALAPQFIAAVTRGVIGGQPVHYRRGTGGTFILYSIGWDGRDHGGERGSARGKANADGDWVWPAFEP
jgi:hypothetical protein